jgi:hypothetical protein
LVLAGCSGGTASPGSTNAPTTSASPAAPSSAATLSVEEGGPLEALGTCAPPPEPIEADVPGLLLPEGALVTEVQEQGELVRVDGYVEQTPIQVRQFYQQVPDIELFEIEDEVFEAEALFSWKRFRSYVKAQARCEQGWTLIAFVGPAGDSGVPSVGGG